MKPQDIVILAKLISFSEKDLEWSQNSIAVELCLSPSQINASLKRLVESGLITPYHSRSKPFPILQACEEFFIHGFKYCFPAKIGQITRGIATSYAAPPLNSEIVIGNDPVPVWPSAIGNIRGVELIPLYPCVPESIQKYPDEIFYKILTLLDAIRSGRARERNIAVQKISEILK
jgi:hypothetical protein